MSYYRIIATPQGPMATKLISGTLWGHMAWAIRYMEGEDALCRWLSEQESQPWLFSSQMPEGMLPKPLLLPGSKNNRINTLETLEQRKNIRKLRYISEKVFFQCIKKMSESVLAKTLEAESEMHAADSILEPIQMAHNRIDRLTGRTPDEGGLYFDETKIARDGARLQLFMKCPASCFAQVQTILDYIGANGFGANASTGCGSIRFEILEETSLFSSGGTRAMSLSHGTRTDNMYSVRYRQHVHFGKMGGHYAMGVHSPFKYPVLMMQPGATFIPDGEGPFGELLKDVHPSPELKAVRHHALHLPIYYTEAVS